jgi:hypothetical protein
MLNNIDNRFLVLAWLAICSLFIGAAGTLSGCTSTARASTVEIIDVSHVETIESEVISPPIEFHVTPTSFYMVETVGEHETYMVGDTRIDAEPGTLTLYN